MVVTNERIYRVVEKQQSSCKPVKSVRDVHGIGHGDDDEHEERNVKPSELEISEERDFYVRKSELVIKPPRSDTGKNQKENHFYPCGKPLSSSISKDVEIIVDDANGSNGKEGEKGEIRFVTVPERVLDVYAEPGLYFRRVVEEYNRYGNQKEYGKQYDQHSHGRSSLLLLVKLCELRGGSDERFGTDGFSQLVFP